MKVLVTGATGFIGQHLVEMLVEKKYEVLCFVREINRAKSLFGDQVDYIQGDITDYQSIEKAFNDIDAVIHLAAETRDYGPSKNFWKVNVQGTDNILKASVKHQIKRFIFLSTVMVMGPYPEQFADEGHHYEKSGILYPDTKIEAEKLVNRYHFELGLPITIIRPGVVYGPGNCPSVMRTLRMAKIGFPLYIGGGKGVCNHTYVDNLAEVILLTLIKEKSIGKTYIITDGVNLTTWKKFMTRIYFMTSVKKVYISIPRIIALPLSYFFDFLSRIIPFKPPITPLMVYILSNRSMYNIEAAKNDLDYFPRIQLSQGLNETADWLMDHGWI